MGNSSAWGMTGLAGRLGTGSHVGETVRRHRSGDGETAGATAPTLHMTYDLCPADVMAAFPSCQAKAVNPCFT
ncbi:hypothetical protein Aph02nite_23420 [Actinoplanes philippinensis]|nr:hypothetical protein Aph02nite_23420 [Actinoplanes philippinensis]